MNAVWAVAVVALVVLIFGIGRSLDSFRGLEVDSRSDLPREPHPIAIAFGDGTNGQVLTYSSTTICQSCGRQITSDIYRLDLPGVGQLQVRGCRRCLAKVLEENPTAPRCR